jgi:hypothetical protein
LYLKDALAASFFLASAMGACSDFRLRISREAR